MLHMVAEYEAGPEAFLAVWANHALSEGHHELLLRSCKALAEDPWPAWLSGTDSLDSDIHLTRPGVAVIAAATGSSAAAAAAVAGSSTNDESAMSAEQRIREVCAAWAASSITLDQLLHWRDQLCDVRGGITSALDLSLSAINNSASSSSSSSSSSSGCGKSVRQEVREYIRTGSLSGLSSMPHSESASSSKQQQRLQKPNITFVLAPAMQYTVYYSSSIFRAVALAPSSAGCTTAIQRVLATVKAQLAAAVKVIRAGNLRVQLVPGDVLTIATAAAAAAAAAAAGGGGGGASTGDGKERTQTSHLFDYIDTSNVSDYTSLPALLQACAPLLLPSPHARLRLESIVANNNPNLPQSGLPPEEFVKASVGVNAQTYAALLGLRLLGGCVLQDNQKALRLEWGSSSSSSTGSSHGSATVVGDNSASRPIVSAASLLLDLKPAFKRFVESYLVEPRFSSSSSGGGSGSRVADWKVQGSPLTLAHLVSLAAPDLAAAVVKALLHTAGKGGASGPAGLFKWELTMHIGAPTCLRVSYPTDPGHRLIPHKEDPLLLAISKTPLHPGALSLTSVQQLFSSFGWDEDLAEATVLLPELLKRVQPTWARYITLCVVGNEGLSAVGESKPLAELIHTAVAVSLTPWRKLPAAAAGVRADDLSLIEQLTSGSRGDWCSTVCAAGGHAIVDILAPAAIHVDAVVKVIAADNAVTVVVIEHVSAATGKGKLKAKGPKADVSSGEASGADKALQQGTYTVQLGEGVETGGHVHTKMSRAMSSTVGACVVMRCRSVLEAECTACARPFLIPKFQVARPPSSQIARECLWNNHMRIHVNVCDPYP